MKACMNRVTNKHLARDDYKFKVLFVMDCISLWTQYNIWGSVLSLSIQLSIHQSI